MLEFPLRSAFVALPLENQAKWQFQAWQKELEPFLDCLKLQKPQSPHLTLRFFREFMEIEYQQVVAACEKIAQRHTPFSLQITEAQTFGKAGEERVLYLAVAYSLELSAVKKDCPWPNERTANGEAEEFHPHITLARITHPQRFMVARKKIFAALKGCTFLAEFDRLRLYAQVQGMSQTPLQDFPFA